MLQANKGKIKGDVSSVHLFNVAIIIYNTKETTCSSVIRHLLDTITEMSIFEKEMENSSIKVRILKHSRLETYYMYCEPP